MFVARDDAQLPRKLFIISGKDRGALGAPCMPSRRLSLSGRLSWIPEACSALLVVLGSSPSVLRFVGVASSQISNCHSLAVVIACNFSWGDLAESEREGGRGLQRGG